MSEFADHLYEDLMEQHGAALTAHPVQAPARRRLTRPVWASAGTVAAAATAAVGFTVFSGTASAYAVTDNHDGTVTVKVANPGGIAGANAQLHKMGSRVAVVQAKDGCPSIDTFRAPTRGTGETEVNVMMKGGDPNSVTVSASGLPADETALVVYSFDHGKATSAMVPIKGPAPTCVSLPAAPPPGSVVTDGDGGKDGKGLDSSTGTGDVPGLSEHN